MNGNKWVLAGLAAATAWSLAVGQDQSPISGRVGGAAATEAGSSVIQGRVGGGAATEAGSGVIQGRVGGGAATEAGSRIPAGGAAAIGASTGAFRGSLTGDPFSSRAGLGVATNLPVGSTNLPPVGLRP